MNSSDSPTEVTAKLNIQVPGKEQLRGAFNRFSDFFVQAFKIDVDS